MSTHLIAFDFCYAIAEQEDESDAEFIEYVIQEVMGPHSSDSVIWRGSKIVAIALNRENGGKLIQFDEETGRVLGVR